MNKIFLLFALLSIWISNNSNGQTFDYSGGGSVITFHGDGNIDGIYEAGNIAFDSHGVLYLTNGTIGGFPNGITKFNDSAWTSLIAKRGRYGGIPICIRNDTVFFVNDSRLIATDTCGTFLDTLGFNINLGAPINMCSDSLSNIYIATFGGNNFLIWNGSSFSLMPSAGGRMSLAVGVHNDTLYEGESAGVYAGDSEGVYKHVLDGNYYSGWIRIGANVNGINGNPSSFAWDTLGNMYMTMTTQVGGNRTCLMKYSYGTWSCFADSSVGIGNAQGLGIDKKGNIWVSNATGLPSNDPLFPALLRFNGKKGIQYQQARLLPICHRSIRSSVRRFE